MAAGDWSLHARLCITSPLQQEARCSVTLVGSGPHTVTLTCAEPGPRPVTKDVASQTSDTPKPNRTPACCTRRGGRENPRTVHIDVYCTASESSSSSEDEGCTPRTVFENERLRVVRRRAKGGSVPHALQRQKRRDLSGGETDTSPYPVSMASSVTSTERSTSWKDTGTSLALSDSLDYENSADKLSTSWKDTRTSLAPSDSFDYENSADKLRIKEKERAWAAAKGGSSAPEEEEEEEETSESSSGTELAWSFGRYEELEGRGGSLKRELTVRRVTQPVPVPKSGSLSDTEVPSHRPPPGPHAWPPPTPHSWQKAQKFGTIVGSQRRPGHHVGPSKNPDCSCDTCRYFFTQRHRTHSLGERPEPDGNS